MFKKLVTIVTAMLGLGSCSTGIENVDVPQFAGLLSDTVQLVDVRTPDEYAAGHLEGAVLIDVKSSNFEEQAAAQLDKRRPVAVYCRSGRRSLAAAKLLKRAGYRVTNLKGGILAWEAAGQRVVK